MPCSNRLVNLPERWSGFESSTSGYYADWHNLLLLFKSYVPTVLSGLQLKPSMRALEIGVGSGKWSAAFALMEMQTVAMDYSSDILMQARSNFPYIMFIPFKGDIRNPDVLQSFSADYRTFYLVFSEGLLEHYTDPDEWARIVTNMGTFVLPGGYLILIVPYMSPEPDEIRYTVPKFKREVMKWLPGFEVVRAIKLPVEIWGEHNEVLHNRFDILFVAQKKEAK